MKVPMWIKTEPALLTQIVALLALALIEAIDWVSLGLGEWAGIAGMVLTAAGVTRQSVTPVVKLKD